MLWLLHEAASGMQLQVVLQPATPRHQLIPTCPALLVTLLHLHTS